MKIKSLIKGSVIATLLLVLVGCSGSGGGDTVTSSGELYSLSLIIEGDQYEADNNFSTARSLAIGTTEAHTIFPPNDRDFVKVTLEKGKHYEFFMVNLPRVGDSLINLYDENMSSLVGNDDYIYLDSNIRDYNASYSGTYYVKAESLDQPYGVFEYVSGVKEWVDEDGDGHSSYFDCNDHNNTIYPNALEIAGNGIDEDCGGFDAIVGIDSYEDDDTMAQAKPVATTLGAYEEIEFRSDVYTEMRTLDTTDDVDFFKVDIPAKSKVQLVNLSKGLPYFKWSILESNASVRDSGTNGFSHRLENNTTEDWTLYLKVESDKNATGWYIPVATPLGKDEDGDGVTTKDYWSYDCNDHNASIRPGATDILGDGIDANCDGVDGDA